MHCKEENLQKESQDQINPLVNPPFTLPLNFSAQPISKSFFHTPTTTQAKNLQEMEEFNRQKEMVLLKIEDMRQKAMKINVQTEK